MANINDSNGFELASTASTGMIQQTMANTQERCNSNGSEQENPCFSHISQASRGIVSSRSGYPATAMWSYVGNPGNPGKPPVSNGSQPPIFGETEADYPHVGKPLEPRNTSDSSTSNDGLPSLPSITQWARGIIGNPAPSDEEYRRMSDEQVSALANTQGLYASKAWAERERRREMESRGVPVNA
jgi:hypothetical protein